MGESERTSKIRPLVFLLLLHVLLFIIFQFLNKTFQTWDSAGHIGMSFYLADRLRSFFSGEGGISLVDLLKTSNYYPPLVQFIGSLVSLAFGYSSELLTYVSLVFFLIAMVFLYKVVMLITSDSKRALFTVFVFSFFPQIIEQSRVFHLDIPLVALLLIAFYFLIRSRGFSQGPSSALFFVFFGLAQVTKWYAWIYIAIPVAVELYKLFIEKDRYQRSKRIFNLGGGVILFIFISLPWYLVNIRELVDFVRIFGQGELDDPANVLSLESILYYPDRILSFQIFLLPFVFVLLGLLRGLKGRGKSVFYLIASIAVPLAVFTLISNKNLRYILPLTPIFAYIIVDFLLSIKGKLSGLIYVLGAYMVLSAAFVTLNHLPPTTPILKPIGVMLAGPKYMDWYHNPGVYSYEKYKWPVDDVLDFIVEDANFPSDRGLGITVLADSKNFSLATFEMLRREKKLDNAYVPVPYFRTFPFESKEALEGYFEENDVSYVVVPQDPGPEGLRNYAVLSQLIRYFTSALNTTFTPVGDFDLPDGNRLVVYKSLNLTELQVGECITTAGFGDGVEAVRLIPNTTFIFYTGHFAVEDSRFEFEEGTLYLFQMENTVHESILNVHALPNNGSSMCVRGGLGIDLATEIEKPLTEQGHCGVDCQKVVHVKWSVGDEEFVVEEHVR